MRRILLIIAALVVLAGASLIVPQVRSGIRGLIRPEPPAQITPLAVSLPATITPTALLVATVTHTVPTAIPATSTSVPSATPEPSVTLMPTGSATDQPMQSTRTPDEPTIELPTATLVPTDIPTLEPPTPEPPTAVPEPTSAAVTVNGRQYDAYIPAATKSGQAYQYSCEFDAAWAILKTYSIDVSVDELVAIVGVDPSVEPYIEETSNGFIIHGGDIVNTFSGDYTKNFLARSSATAIRKAFAHFDLGTTLVTDRAGVEAALLRGELVWIKTTVDFKPWRPATWVMPDGRTHQTVLGNDHAVVVMGFNADTVVIRDVLGPTSTNRQRPYEYEVSWDTFMAAWGAQSYDGLAVERPQS